CLRRGVMRPCASAGWLPERSMDSLKCPGVWWTPNDPKLRVGGILHVSRRQELSLELLGALPGEDSVRHVGEKSFSTILGMAESPIGRQVTLRDCWLQHLKLRMPELTTEGYHVGRAFFGAHLTAGDESRFPSCTLAYSGLSAWAWSLRGIE